MTLGVVLVLVIQLPALIDAFGTGAFVANLLFILASLAAGCCWAGRSGIRGW